ncbi:SH3 domain-containing protein [Actinophytocola oryzae]|uniref:SH3 domain-containing protein n=1 Tax=Actinophytocola oryzae TaxID=502181 RepID=A0A4V3FQY2_9PSEU|nr:SH3 domain-containing protein [Actinophytocola oryzae]TDV41431.1 hypothetical protein CLV71_120121 [Actinophytocola oryzae]
MALKLTGKRTVVTVALLAGVGVLYVQGKDEQHQKQGPASVDTTICRVASTEDGVRVRSAPAIDPANIVDELAQGEEADASNVIQNGFRKLSEGHWVSVDYIRPLAGRKC